MTGQIPESLELPAAKGQIKAGQHLYSGNTEISDSMLMISADYEKHLAKDLAGILEICIALLIIYTIYCNKLPFP